MLLLRRAVLGLCGFGGFRGFLSLLGFQVVRVRFCLNRLNDDAHFNLVPDLGRVLAQPKVRALERGQRVETDRWQAAPGIRTYLDEGDIERDRFCHSMEAEVAGDLELVLHSALLHPGALEGRTREPDRVEEICRAEVLIQVGYARVEGAQ